MDASEHEDEPQHSEAALHSKCGADGCREKLMGELHVVMRAAKEAASVSDARVRAAIGNRMPVVSIE